MGSILVYVLTSAQVVTSDDRASEYRVLSAVMRTCDGKSGLTKS